MTIAFFFFKEEVKRHLSIIGKRLYAKDGQNMFANITVSTAEDPILEQYINAGTQNVEAMLRQLVTEYSVTQTGITITIANTRGAEDFDLRCADLIKTYVTLFTVGEYLAMTHPDIAAKYQTDAANAMQSLIVYAYYKNPPIKNPGGGIEKAPTDPISSVNTTIS